MKVEVNISKWNAVLIVVGVAVVLGLGFVWADWSVPSSGVWHTGEETRVNISGEYHSLQDAIDGGLIGGGGGGGGVYVGATSGSYDGAEVGGYAGGDAKCNAEYPGSRMAMAADFADGRPEDSGWYNTYLTGSQIGDCAGWTESYSTWLAPYWSAGIGARQASCSTKHNILCSMPSAG
jgi:hypothetical protein